MIISNKHGFDMYIPSMRVLDKPKIRITSEFSENDIPTLGDLVTGEFRPHQMIQTMGSIEVDVNHMPEEGKLYQVIEQDGKIILIENLLTKLSELIIRKSLISSRLQEIKNHQLAMYRYKQELALIDGQISDLKNIKITAASIHTSMVIIEDDGVSFFSSEPIASYLKNNMMEVEIPKIPNHIYEYENGLSEEIDFGTVLARIESKIEGSIRSYYPPKVFGGKFKLDSSQIAIDNNTLQFLISNRHVLATCSDIIYNLVIEKPEFTANELLDRGLTLRSILTNFSHRFPFLQTEKMRRKDILTSTGELLYAIHGDKSLLQLSIDDINTVQVVNSTNDLKGINRDVTTFCFIGFLSGCTSKTIDNKSITLHFGTSSISFKRDTIVNSFLELSDSQVEKVCSTIMAITAMLKCSLAINTDTTNQFSIDIRALITRFIPNFIIRK